MAAQAQSGMVAGAQAGAAFGPWGAAIGGAAGLASDLANSPTGPMISGGGSIDARSFMDGSGWTVSTGKATATGGKSGGGTQGGNTNPSGGGTGTGAGASFAGMGFGMDGSQQAGMQPLMLLALGGLVLWALLS